MKSDPADALRAHQSATRFLELCPQLREILQKLKPLAAKPPNEIGEAYLRWAADFARVTCEMRCLAVEFRWELGWKVFPSSIDEGGPASFLGDALQQLNIISRLPKKARLYLRGPVVRVGSAVFVAHEGIAMPDAQEQEHIRQAFLRTGRNLLRGFTKMHAQVLAYRASGIEQTARQKLGDSSGPARS